MTKFKRFKRSSNHHFAVNFPGCILLVCRREKLPTVAAEKWLYRTGPDRSGVGWHSKFRSVTTDIYNYSQTTWTVQHGCRIRMCIYNAVYIYLWFQQQHTHRILHVYTCMDPYILCILKESQWHATLNHTRLYNSINHHQPWDVHMGISKNSGTPKSSTKI